MESRVLTALPNECLVHFLLYDTPESRQNSQQDLSPASSGAISQVVWNPVSVQAAASLTSCVKASHRWWVCNKLYHAQIIHKQNAKKIVKNNIDGSYDPEV